MAYQSLTLLRLDSKSGPFPLWKVLRRCCCWKMCCLMETPQWSCAKKQRNVHVPKQTSLRTQWRYPSWWFQPIWKIWVKMGSSSPKFGVKITKIFVKPPLEQPSDPLCGPDITSTIKVDINNTSQQVARTSLRCELSTLHIESRLICVSLFCWHGLASSTCRTKNDLQKKDGKGRP